jgi:hypothetical protein
MTPQELVSDALDAVAADANEIVAGAQSPQVYQQCIADATALQAMMLTRLLQRSCLRRRGQSDQPRSPSEGEGK